MRLLLLIVVMMLVGCSSAPQAPLLESITLTSLSTRGSAPPSPPPPPPPRVASSSLVWSINPAMSQGVFSTIVGSARPPESSVENYQPTNAEVRRSPIFVRSSPPIKPTVIVDDIAAQLRTAAMVVEVPEKANVTEHFDVKLTIDPIKLVEQLVQESTGRVAESGMIIIARVTEATLTAPDFQVIQRSAGRQAISTTSPTIWLWRLSGAKPGKRDIFLTVNAIVSVEGDRAERTIVTFSKAVVIEITPTQRMEQLIKQYWQWLWTTLLLPAGMWLWKRYKPTSTQPPQV